MGATELSAPVLSGLNCDGKNYLAVSKNHTALLWNEDTEWSLCISGKSSWLSFSRFCDYFFFFNGSFELKHSVVFKGTLMTKLVFIQAWK